MKDFIIFIGILGMIILLVVGIVIAPSAIHNNKLNKFADNLFNYPLPRETHVLSKNKRVGLLVANGDHCDYEACLIVSTKLNKYEVVSFYRTTSLPAADKDTTDITISVELLKEGDEKENNIFKISILDSGYSPALDLRCY